MENRVSFRHFNPDGTELQGCSSLLSLVDDLAPSDAAVQAIVDRVRDGTYRAMITVRSFGGNFNSECSGFSAATSLKRAQESILNSLEDWKAQRFQPGIFSGV